MSFLLSVSHSRHRFETFQNGNYESLDNVNAYNGFGVRLRINDQGQRSGTLTWSFDDQGQVTGISGSQSADVTFNTVANTEEDSSAQETRTSYWGFTTFEASGYGIAQNHFTLNQV